MNYIHTTSLRNQFLIAMPQLEDNVFSGCIAYICDHSTSGAMGLIINHPLDLHLDDVFQYMHIEEQGTHHQPVMAGGPVEMDRGFVLHKGGDLWDSTMPISHDISLTTSKDIIRDIAQDQGPGDSLVALGYAGWNAGQLEHELASNFWLTMPADPDILFRTPCELRAQAAAALLGIDIHLIAPPGHG